jgi:hypothetical protein
MVTRSAAHIEGAKRSMRMGFHINEIKYFHRNALKQTARVPFPCHDRPQARASATKSGFGNSMPSPKAFSDPLVELFWPKPIGSAVLGLERRAGVEFFR